VGLLDKLFGTARAKHRDRGGAVHEYEVGSGAAAPPRARRTGVTGRTSDEIAVERYRYMLRTAPPDTVEQAHAEAFAALTPEQRRQVLAELSASSPEAERGSADDPRSLARAATRAELREPGTMERTLGGGRPGTGMGGVLAGSLLASVAGSFIGTSVAGAFLDNDEAGAEEAAAQDMSSEEPHPADTTGDASGMTDPGGDGGLGDIGGDVGI
jgi:hypothetical protein